MTSRTDSAQPGSHATGHATDSGSAATSNQPLTAGLVPVGQRPREGSAGTLPPPAEAFLSFR